MALDIKFEDKHLLVINKPPGIGAQADKTGDDSLLEQAEAYCRQPLQLVHRIDRPASGLVLLAKTKAAMAALSEQFRTRQVEKTYWAAVQQAPPEPSGHLVHFLKKNEKTNRSHLAEEGQPGAEKAELNYRLIGSSKHYHLLEIQLLTGRHHQIRAQLAAIGCPIKGDVKYGARRSNLDRSIHLHAKHLSFEHPVLGNVIALEAAPPADDPVWAGFMAEGSGTGMNELTAFI